MSGFLPENRAIQFGYLPEFLGPGANTQRREHTEELFVYNNDFAVITLGFNPERAIVYFTDGADGADTVSISLTTASGHPAIDLQWNVVSPSGRAIEYKIFEVVT